MISFYGDDNYSRSSLDDTQPRIILFGGILISDDEGKKLVNIIKKEKKKYTHENLPLKWNFKDKDIKDKFKEFDRIDQHKELLRNSRDIRINIAKESLNVDYKIIISCIKSYSNIKKKIKNNKTKNTEFLFENLLFRLGMEADNTNNYQIILDWPSDSNPKVFNRPYYYIYNTNKTIHGSKNYCGPLCNKNFNPSLLYAKCTHSPCLQFTDFVVGAFKDYLEMTNTDNKSCVGKEFIDIIKPKFRTSRSGKISGYGIIVSSGNSELKKTITTIFDKGND